MTKIKIEDLLEYPLVLELGRALWSVGDLRGAAVMVGAGLSRNADRPGPTTVKSASWAALVGAMREGLGYPDDDATEPLEVAQQYDAMFGRPALDGLIREKVPDLSLEPGPLHRRLLRLPWTEVLTTNYDTLLERSAERSPGQTFEVVRSQGDISRTRSPRIVKLHGSLPSGPFVIASEDYRRYPVESAAMVNLVQQVLLEKHLVLIGFSATDPNFLSWTGWVRDNLGRSARRLILVGLFDLTTGARRVLESRNVSVVDLSRLVEDEDPEDKHSVALDRFLAALEGVRPPSGGEWELSSPPADVMAGVPGQTADAKAPTHWFDVDAAARRLKDRLPGLQADRQAYPGWIVAPHHVRELLANAISVDRPQIAGAVAALPDPERFRIIFELAWRNDIALLDQPQWLLKEIERVLGSDVTAPLTSREVFQLCIFDLRAARERRERTSFEKMLDWTRRHRAPDPDLAAEVAFEEALWAKEGLDLQKLSELAERLDGRDPIFLLRKALLFCELASFERSFQLVSEALAELRNRRARDRHSIWVRSRYGWALYIARRIGWSRRNSPGADREASFEDLDEIWPRAELADGFCDPSDEFQALDEALSEAERNAAKKRVSRRPGFDAGAYTRQAFGGDAIRADRVALGGVALRISYRAGIPALFDHVLLCKERIERSLGLMEIPHEEQLIQVCSLLDSRRAGGLEKFFGRLSVSTLSLDAVRALIDRLLSGVDELLLSINHQASKAAELSRYNSRQRTAILLEIASRLVIRLPPTEADAVLARGFAWARDPRWEHGWTSETLQNLMSRAIEALPSADRVGLLEEIARFPLPGEKPFSHLAHRWPEPSHDIDLGPGVSRPGAPLFAIGVSRLIDAVGTGSKLDRIHAAGRLGNFYRWGILTAEERSRLASAIWSRLDATGLPSETRFHTFAFLDLPEVHPGQADEAVRAAFLRGERVVFTKELAHLLGAVRPSAEGGTAYFRLSSEEARNLLDVLLLPETIEECRKTDDFGDPCALSALAGGALAFGILSVLDLDSIGSERLDTLVAVMTSRGFSSGALAWPQVVRLEPVRLERCTDEMLADLLCGTGHRVNAALSAVELWRTTFSSGDELASVPTPLVRTVISLIATRRFPELSNALRVASNFFEAGFLDRSDIKLVLCCLEHLMNELNDVGFLLEEGESIAQFGTASLARREAARFALVLKRGGERATIIDQWAAMISDDPYPKVRSLVEEQDLW